MNPGTGRSCQYRLAMKMSSSRSGLPTSFSPLLVSFSMRRNHARLYWLTLLRRLPNNRTPSWLSWNRKPRKSDENGCMPTRMLSKSKRSETLRRCLSTNASWIPTKFSVRVAPVAWVDVDAEDFVELRVVHVEHRSEPELVLRRFEYGVALVVLELERDVLNRGCLIGVAEHVDLAGDRVELRPTGVGRSRTSTTLSEMTPRLKNQSS